MDDVDVIVLNQENWAAPKNGLVLRHKVCISVFVFALVFRQTVVVTYYCIRSHSLSCHRPTSILT